MNLVARRTPERAASLGYTLRLHSPNPDSPTRGQPMTTTDTTTVPALPAHAQLIQMAGAAWMAAALYAAAKLGIADHLAAGREAQPNWPPRPEHTRRRCTASCGPWRGLGILTEAGAAVRAHAARRGAEDRRARLGAIDDARVLRTADLAKLGGDRLFARDRQDRRSRRSGACRLFDYLARDPEEASHFSEAMVGFHGAEPPTVAEAYDFSGSADRRRRRRRDGQHAGRDPVATTPSPRRAVRSAARRARRAGVA